jgi:hypothetical protein
MRSHCCLDSQVSQSFLRRPDESSGAWSFAATHGVSGQGSVRCRALTERLLKCARTVCRSHLDLLGQAEREKQVCAQEGRHFCNLPCGSIHRQNLKRESFIHRTNRRLVVDSQRWLAIRTSRDAATRCAAVEKSA